MAKKSGQITPRRKDTWLVRITIGTDANGKRIRINETVHGTRADAQHVLNQLLVKKDTGQLSTSTMQTVNSYLEHWQETALRPRVRGRTFSEYVSQLNRYVKPELGETTLSKLQPLAIQAVYAKMLARGLSPRTVRLTHTIFNNALKQAVKWRILPFNLASAVELPKYRPPEMMCLSEGESATFLRVIEGDKFEHLFNLLLTTGLRPSEAVGLKWSDLDLVNHTLSVNRTLSRVNKAWVFEPPKTRKSKRTIDIPVGLSDLLRQREPNPGLVFRNDVGEPLHLRSVISDYFKPALERAGIKPETRLYDLRHTCATLLLLGGDPNDQLHIKLISEYLGHANINITLDTYGHVLPGMHKRVAAKMEPLLYAPDEDESDDDKRVYN